MGHMRDCISYSNGTSITAGCFVTGKPVVIGGIVGRREATGQGVVATIVAACKRLNRPISKFRAAVQGFGNVGAVAAQAMIQQGASVVAVSDITGGVHHKDGLDIPKLIEHVKTRRTAEAAVGFSVCRLGGGFRRRCIT